MRRRHGCDRIGVRGECEQGGRPNLLGVLEVRLTRIAMSKQATAAKDGS